MSDPPPSPSIAATPRPSAAPSSSLNPHARSFSPSSSHPSGELPSWLKFSPSSSLSFESERQPPCRSTKGRHRLSPVCLKGRVMLSVAPGRRPALWQLRTMRHHLLGVGSCTLGSGALTLVVRSCLPHHPM
jgi:hypothetical protein